MRVLILGEGPNELGKARNPGESFGLTTLKVLVTRLLTESSPHVTVEATLESIRMPRRFGARKQPTGFDNRLQALLALSIGRNADAFVAVVDRDGPKNDAKPKQLEKGRDALTAKQKPCAVGLAIETIEAWLLADVKGLQRALSDISIMTQKNPESTWSNNRSHADHPKIRLRNIIDQAQAASEQAESTYSDHYARIAEHADLHTIEKRCPKGFRPFAEQVRTLSKGQEQKY